MVPTLGFHQMLDALPAAVYATDRDGVLTYFNPACIAFAGRTPVVGVDRWCVTPSMLHPDGTPMPCEQSPMAMALREGREVRGVQVIAERPDGTRVWFEPYPTPLRDDTGQVIGGINMLVETTDRRHAGEAQVRLAAIVESSDDAIISKDLNGIITSWNLGAQKLFGYTAEETIGRPVTMLMPPDRVNEEPGILARIRRGEKIDHYETVRQRKDGTRLDISLTVSPLRNAEGRIVGASKIARDITERKRADQMLREADRTKDQFLATLAHELRNPLAPIMNSIELLNRIGAQTPDATKARETIHRQVNHLSRLVDDLLNLSRINSGKLTLQRKPIDLSAVLNAALDTCQPMVKQFDHELTVSLPAQPIWIDGDSVRLAQVFGNLCNNACKYTARGGRIHIRAEREGDTAVINVRDTGIGLPGDQLESIFSIFSQVNQLPEREQGGLGIGLHLVKRLVEMHGGNVSAHSSGLGQGSEFVVRLPALPVSTTAPGSENRTVAAAPVEDGGPRHRILIVDDNRDAAEILSRLLSRNGHQTQLAFDGEQAVKEAAAFAPDLVLLDIGLPKLNGYDACRAIRANAAPESRPRLVALTGWGQEDDRARSRDAGFDAHMTKPISFDELNKFLAGLPAPFAAASADR